MKKDVPLCRPSIEESDIQEMAQIVRSGWLAHGQYNHDFEHEFCHQLGIKHAITMNSCTSALEIALKVAGIKGEVIVPSMTWVATANSVITTGGTPVFCEVDRATRNVTAETIAAHITPRTEAVIVVHFGGQPCAMGPIMDLCRKHNLFLIEDSAETLGATWDGRQAGSFTVGCFSFFPTKNITTGEGGMLSCVDDAFAAKVRALIAHGVESSTFAREKAERPWLRAATMAGHNFRMPNPLAVLGLRQMQRLGSLNARRQALAERYRAAFSALEPALVLPHVDPKATHVWQMYTIEVSEAIRDRLVLALRERGIGASVHFDPPVHLQPYYLERGCRSGSLPVTEKLARELVTLPMFPDMTHEEQDWVIEGVRSGLA
jgi:perosamine synthetase